MKKLLLLLLFPFMTACMTTYDYVEVSTAPYTDMGLYLDETNSPNFPYRPIGNIEVFYAPAKEMSLSDLKKAALDLACEKAIMMQANGIINLKFVYDFMLVPNLSGRYDRQPGYRITGMAIRRQNKKLN